MVKRLRIQFFVLVGLFWSVTANAAIVVVTTLADDQNVNGKCSLREAIINSNQDNQSGSIDCLAGSGADSIHFKDELEGTIQLNSHLPAINQNLTIKGHTDRKIEISGNYALRVFEITAGLTVNLRDLAIMKGSEANGGGIRTADSILNIQNCLFIGNSARNSTYGGGILNYNGTLNIVDSEFRDNWADIGGGIDSNGTLVVKNCIFEKNNARVGSGISNSGKAEILDSIFKANKIKHSGGGISNSGVLQLRNVLIADHTTTTTGQGAGINNIGEAELYNVVVKNNSAGTGGGIFNLGNLQLVATTVEENQAVCSGGGIFNGDKSQMDVGGEGGRCKITKNSAANGGGIYSQKASVMISQSDISGNSASNTAGGGILNYDGSLEIHDAVISSNHAYKGAGLYVKGNAQLYGVSFLRNIGEAAGAVGAGAFLSDGRTNLENVVFEKNEAMDEGGGIYNLGTMVLRHGKFIANKNASGAGGGIYNLGQADTISTTFSDNWSYKGGGGIYNKGELEVSKCTFSSNFGAANGGAIYNSISESGKELKLINSTLSGNMTDDLGGGIYNEGIGTAVLINTTLSGNTAIGQRSNIHKSAGVVKLKNSLVTGDQPGSNCIGDVISLGYNLANDDSCDLTQSTDLPDTVPNIGPLADNGGDTLTHALLSGSPAMDQVPKNVNDCGGLIDTDQRGKTRPQPINGKCDIGAYEVLKSLSGRRWPIHRWPIHN